MIPLERMVVQAAAVFAPSVPGARLSRFVASFNAVAVTRSARLVAKVAAAKTKLLDMHVLLEKEIR
jgi:hypothetical protein